MISQELAAILNVSPEIADAGMAGFSSGLVVMWLLVRADRLLRSDRQ